MKRLYILLILLILPLMVNAETLTYDVCDTCEYKNYNDVKASIDSISDLSDKDIIINFNINGEIVFMEQYGSETNQIKSITLNGTKETIINPYYGLGIHANTVIINNIKFQNSGNYGTNCIGVTTDKIIINNSEVSTLILSISGDKSSNELNNILQMDDYSKERLKVLTLANNGTSNVVIRELQLENARLSLIGGNYEIYNSAFSKIFHYPSDLLEVDSLQEISSANIYNSKFKSIKYKEIPNIYELGEDEMEAMYYAFMIDKLSNDIYEYDIYNINARNPQTDEYTEVETNIFFDKELNIKPNDKVNLAEYLDYYTEDKEIEYTIEDESIAKIENKELTALKEGSTKVTVTTDEGHVVYRINLVVEKETIPEKIDKMTIKVPITGSKLKLWVLIVGGILLGIVGICASMLIKRKK